VRDEQLHVGMGEDVQLWQPRRKQHVGGRVRHWLRPVLPTLFKEFSARYEKKVQPLKKFFSFKNVEVQYMKRFTHTSHTPAVFVSLPHPFFEHMLIN
jgi:hypothetical protein